MVAGASILLGSLVAQRPMLAVAMVFLLCVGVSLLAADPSRRVAPLLLMLGLPLYGAGLSESSWTTGAAAALLLIGGSVYGWLVSLAWPAGEAAPRPARAPTARSTMLVYGVQLGLAEGRPRWAGSRGPARERPASLGRLGSTDLVRRSPGRHSAGVRVAVASVGRRATLGAHGKIWSIAGLERRMTRFARREAPSACPARI